MRKIAIFQKDLQIGGIQRSVINMLNNLDGYEIDLYLFNKDIQLDINDIKKKNNINIIYLGPLSEITKFIFFKVLIKFFRKKYKISKKYDLAIDFNSYSNETAICTILSNASKKVMWIHSNLKEKYKNELKYKILHFFSKGKYKYFDEFIFVSEPIVESFYELNNLKSKRNIVIPNYIDVTNLLKKSEEKIDINLNIDENNYNLVTVGRMIKAKGFDILINKLFRVIEKRKDIHLYIVGDGPERKSLERKIKELNLNKYVTLIGYRQNPYNIMKLMDGFVLTSRYEGQGIVIMEAKTLGLDLYISKNIEKYCPGVKGSLNIEKEIINAKKKKERKIDMIKSYNDNIHKKMIDLFESIK